MAIISLFSGIFCREDSLVNKIAESTGYHLVRDIDLIHEASKMAKISENKIERSFSAKTSVFNKFTHERERSVAHLKLALAGKIFKDNMIIDGFAGQLLPENLNHVLRVCLIADMKARIALAM